METRCLVVDVGSEEQLQVVLDSAKEAEALVVIDYSTTWCGPCKVRVVMQLSAVFLLSCLGCGSATYIYCAPFDVSSGWLSTTILYRGAAWRSLLVPDVCFHFSG